MKDNVCYSQDKLIGCKNDSKTIYGCIECEEEYYLKDKECYNCSLNCISCKEETGYCNKCLNEYVLKKNKCIHYSDILKCKSEEHNKCSKCSFWY